MKNDLAIFEGHGIRRIFDDRTETWFFSVVDIIQVLTQQQDYQTARKYWNKLKERLRKEGSESVTDCHRLKLPSADGKSYITDVCGQSILAFFTLSSWLQQAGFPSAKNRPLTSRSRAGVALGPRRFPGSPHNQELTMSNEQSMRSIAGHSR
ncbi:MAG: hypothetical protein WC765_01710 [Phycisphaerae bacterium]|jgi:hypothetical protein